MKSQPLILLLLLASACDAGGDLPTPVATSPDRSAEPNSSSASEPARHDSTAALARRPLDARGRRAPLSVRIESPKDVPEDGNLPLRVVIERTVGADPLDVRVMLPAGVVLVSGVVEERIVDPSPYLERVLVVRPTKGIPADDLRVLVETGGASYGAHARAVHRFGRAKPVLADPPRSPRVSRVNGRKLGRPIPLR